MPTSNQTMAAGVSDSKMAACVLPDRWWPEIGAALQLSPRELEIVRLLLRGFHEPDVAKSLDISIHTVHTHLGRIYRKIGVHGLPELLVRLFAVYVDLVGDNHSDSSPC